VAVLGLVPGQPVEPQPHGHLRGGSAAERPDPPLAIRVFADLGNRRGQRIEDRGGRELPLEGGRAARRIAVQEENDQQGQQQGQPAGRVGQQPAAARAVAGFRFGGPVDALGRRRGRRLWNAHGG